MGKPARRITNANAELKRKGAAVKDAVHGIRPRILGPAPSGSPARDGISLRGLHWGASAEAWWRGDPAALAKSVRSDEPLPASVRELLAAVVEDSCRDRSKVGRKPQSSPVLRQQIRARFTHNEKMFKAISGMGGKHLPGALTPHQEALARTARELEVSESQVEQALRRRNK